MKIPVPFAGWIETEDIESLESMLKEAYQKGWSDAIDAATNRLRQGFDNKGEE